jgi:hypothetical protein
MNPNSQRPPTLKVMDEACMVLMLEMFWLQGYFRRPQKVETASPRRRPKPPTPATGVSPRFLNYEQAAAHLGTTVWQIRTRKWSGDLRAIRVGKRDLFAIEDLDQLADKLIKNN